MIFCSGIALRCSQARSSPCSLRLRCCSSSHSISILSICRIRRAHRSKLIGNCRTRWKPAAMTPKFCCPRSLKQADPLAKRLESLPEVSRTLTLSNFIPRDQDAKMAAIRTAAHGLDAAVSPPQRQPAPSDDELIASIRASAADLSKAADNRTGPGADTARNVSALLERLAGSDVATRGTAA